MEGYTRPGSDGAWKWSGTQKPGTGTGSHQTSIWTFARLRIIHSQMKRVLEISGQFLRSWPPVHTYLASCLGVRPVAKLQIKSELKV